MTAFGARCISHLSWGEAKSSNYSVFWNVKFICVRRKRNTIYVDQLLDKNQVYAEDADFDFVVKFIKGRCVKAKIK